MNIAFVIPKLAFKGGAEIYMIKVAKLLSQKHDVKIYTMNYDSKVFPEVKGLVKDVGMPNLLKSTQGSKASTIVNIHSMKYFNKRISKDHDLYNTHLFPSNFLRLPNNIWTCHEPPRMLYDLYKETLDELTFTQRQIARVYFKFLKTWDQSKTRKNVDFIIANSKHSKQYVKRIYDKDSEVIYPGIDESLLKVKKKTDENLLLSVGRFFPAKRIELVIKAFAEIVKEKPRTKLVLIGTGPEEQNLKILVKNLGLNVLFKGEVSERQLYDYYARAKLTIYTPIREMFGMVPLESTATGTPVVGVKGGYTEVLKQGVKIVKPNIKSLSGAILRLLNDKKQYNKLSRQGKKIVKQHTWSKVALKTETLFKSFKKTS